MKSMLMSSRTALYVVAACAAAITMMSSDAFQAPLAIMTPSRRPPSSLSMSRSEGNDLVGSRRMAIESVFGLAASAAVLAASSSPQQALALDMDAFVNNQVRQNAPCERDGIFST